LTVDQLHPDAHGMIRIAQQVAPALWGLHNP
jgi:lysophospholipase L1-like esterase